MESASNNYFKVVTSLARAIDCIYPFDDASEWDILRAWEAATDCSALLGQARIATWKRPEFLGPWSKAPRVSE